MMVVYNPLYDTWNNFGMDVERDDSNRRLIIANNRFFYAQIDFNDTMQNHTISIFEMKIEDKLLILVI